MKNRKKLILNEILIDILNYLEYLEEYNNECAYTDRKIEKIIKLTKELEKIQNEFFKGE